MSTFNHTAFSDGQIPTAADFNQNWTDLEAVINGDLDRTNIKTQYAQYAVSLRADLYGQTAYTLTIHLPSRTSGPTDSLIIGASADLIINSGAAITPLTITIAAGSTTVGTINFSAAGSTYQSFGGTTAVNSSTDLTVQVQANAAWGNGDYLNVTIYLAQEIMSLSEVQS